MSSIRSVTKQSFQDMPAYTPDTCYIALVGSVDGATSSHALPVSSGRTSQSYQFARLITYCYPTIGKPGRSIMGAAAAAWV
jgi:hypothetical protein